MNPRLLLCALLGACALPACYNLFGPPCAGLGCARGPGTITLHVVDDLSGQPVSELQISLLHADAGGLNAFVDCTVQVDAGVGDAGANSGDGGVAALCRVWQLRTWEGSPSASFTAPGYDGRTVKFDTVANDACCGEAFKPLDQTVALHRT